MTYFSTDIFNKISGNGKIITFRMGIIKVIAATTGSLTIGKYGRKTLLLTGASLQAVSFMVLFFMVKLDYESLLYIPVGVYTYGFSLGLGSCALIYTADVLPSNGIGLVLGIQWALTSVIAKVTPIISKK